MMQLQASKQQASTQVLGKVRGFSPYRFKRKLDMNNLSFQFILVSFCLMVPMIYQAYAMACKLWAEK